MRLVVYQCKCGKMRTTVAWTAAMGCGACRSGVYGHVEELEGVMETKGDVDDEVLEVRAAGAEGGTDHDDGVRVVRSDVGS